MHRETVTRSREVVELRFGCVRVLEEITVAVYVIRLFRSRHRLVCLSRAVDIGVAVGVHVVAVRSLNGLPYELKPPCRVYNALKRRHGQFMLDCKRDNFRLVELGRRFGFAVITHRDVVDRSVAPCLNAVFKHIVGLRAGCERPAYRGDVDARSAAFSKSMVP